MNSQELRQQRAALVAEARKIYDTAKTENREATGEESEKFDRIMADADKLAGDIERAERGEKLEYAEAELRASTGRKTAPVAHQFATVTDADRKAALRAWALYGTDHADNSSDTLVRAANCGLKLASRSLNVRALSKGTASAGGYTVPVNLASQIEQKLKYYSPIRGVASALVTDSGADLDYPRVDDVSSVAAIVSEAGSIGTSTDPTFDKVTLKAFKWASPIVKCSVELLSDSNVDIESLIADLFAERMGRGQEAKFITGSGTGEPQGLVTGASVGATLASGNAFTFDKVLDLIHSVDIAYRQNGAFLTHDSSLAALRKLKDSNGAYVWSPSVQVGQPDRLFGYPVIVSNSFAEYAGSEGDNKPLVLFGDMRRYIVRDVASSMTVTRLDELYAATGEVGFVMLMRTDGRYIGHSGCVKSLNSYDAA